MTSRPKVLVVDDSEITIRWVTSALSASYEVVGESSTMQAAAAIYREQPDLILLDVKMPVLRGDEIVDLIREALGTRRPPIVLFSSLPTDEIERTVAVCGADGYITKTEDPEQLRWQVADFLKTKP